MRELRLQEVNQVNGAVWANVGGAVIGGISSGYGYFAGNSNPSIRGAIYAIGGGAIGGAFSPVTTIGRAAAIAGAGFSASWVSSGGFDNFF